jgi:hypothetical protein
MTGRQPLSPEAMLAYLQEHAYRDGDCLTWAGPFQSSGEPRIMWHRQEHLARRLLVALSGRELRPKDRVFDTCGNRKCMTLAHLRIGTHAQALKQRAKEGAYPSGARRSLAVAVGRAKNARMGIHAAPAVLRMRAEGRTYKEIAALYGVHPSAVGHALKAWARAGITEWRAAA